MKRMSICVAMIAAAVLGAWLYSAAAQSENTDSSEGSTLAWLLRRVGSPEELYEELVEATIIRSESTALGRVDVVEKGLLRNVGDTAFLIVAKNPHKAYWIPYYAVQRMQVDTGPVTVDNDGEVIKDPDAKRGGEVTVHLLR